MNLLKISYLVGGIYDLLLGFGIIFLRTPLLTFLNHYQPNIPIIVDALGLFLLGFGLLLVFESKNEKPTISIGITSALIRLIYFLFVIYYLMFSSIEILYLTLGFTDLITGSFILYAIYKIN